jgi:phage terminase large subunit
MEIVIPYAPRPLQLSLHAEMQAKRWGVVVCHRRFGKTVWAINHILRDAIMCGTGRHPGMPTWRPPIARRRM